VARHHELSGSSWCWETIVLGLGVGTMNCLAVHGARKQLGYVVRGSSCTV
jgi:hypothetical protein